MSKITFAPIPNDILRRTDISSSAKLCCARLIQYAGQDSEAFPKLQTLGNELGMSARNVQRLLLELEEKGLIVKHQRGCNRSNMYYVDKSILIHRRDLDTTDLSSPNRTKLSTPDTTNVSYPYRRKENFKKEIEKITLALGDKMRMPR